MRTLSGRSSSGRSRPLHVTSLLVVIALFSAACSPVVAPPTPAALATPVSSGTSTTPSPGAAVLKPLDQATLQAVVAATAQELMVPGAVVLVRTPQGEFIVHYGTTELGAASPPSADTHFRIASNTKTMTAAVIMELVQ